MTKLTEFEQQGCIAKSFSWINFSVGIFSSNVIQLLPKCDEIEEFAYKKVFQYKKAI
jgi:hypothetical protein